MSALDIPNIQALPQTLVLQQLANTLWHAPEVCALWLSGSIVTGKADRYSDIDLRIAVQENALPAWQQPEQIAKFLPPLLIQTQFSIAPEITLHHILLESGIYLDISVQPITTPPNSEPRHLIACRVEEFRAHFDKPVLATASFLPDITPATLQQTLEMFWINTGKHQKVLARDLAPMCLYGIQAEQKMLVRLWFAQATGKDCGVSGGTIHTLTPLIQALQESWGERVLAVLGMPLNSTSAIKTGIERMREEVSHVGKLLSSRYNFPYPTHLEQKVADFWQEFWNSKGNNKAL